MLRPEAAEVKPFEKKVASLWIVTLPILRTCACLKLVCGGSSVALLGGLVVAIFCGWRKGNVS